MDAAFQITSPCYRELSPLFSLEEQQHQLIGRSAITAEHPSNESVKGKPEKYSREERDQLIGDLKRTHSLLKAAQQKLGTLQKQLNATNASAMPPPTYAPMQPAASVHDAKSPASPLATPRSLTPIETSRFSYNGGGTNAQNERKEMKRYLKRVKEERTAARQRNEQLEAQLKEAKETVAILQKKLATSAQRLKNAEEDKAKKLAETNQKAIDWKNKADSNSQILNKLEFEKRTMQKTIDRQLDLKQKLEEDITNLRRMLAKVELEKAPSKRELELKQQLEEAEENLKLAQDELKQKLEKADAEMTRKLDDAVREMEQRLNAAEAKRKLAEELRQKNSAEAKAKLAQRDAQIHTMRTQLEALQVQVPPQPPKHRHQESQTQRTEQGSIASGQGHAGMKLLSTAAAAALQKQSIEPAASQPQRKRGRPTKEQAKEKVLQQQPVSQPPRKCGRPAKKVDPVVELLKKSPKGPQAAKKGRPPTKKAKKPPAKKTKQLSAKQQPQAPRQSREAPKRAKTATPAPRQRDNTKRANSQQKVQPSKQAKKQRLF